MSFDPLVALWIQKYGTIDEIGSTQVQNCLLSSGNSCHRMLLIMDVLHRFRGRLGSFVERNPILYY